MELARGVHERLVDEAVRSAIEASSDIADVARLDPAEAAERLARHVASTLRHALEGLPAARRLEAQAALVNDWVDRLGLPDETGVALPARVLTRVRDPAPTAAAPSTPDIPLLDHDLLANAPGEPSLLHALATELGSADRVDAVVAFIRWTGLRLLGPQLVALRRRGVTVRVITTTFARSTQRRSLDWLVEHGVDVRVSYDTATTRLHAKAWLLHRESGFGTAFVGSSNLSSAALVDGIEWNVRVSQASAPSLHDKLGATFESLWQDPSFEPYTATDEQQRRFDAAVATENDVSLLAGLRIQPWHYQEEILEQLRVERERHDRWRNLVVAPTGTGKTVVAAFDYLRSAASSAAVSTDELAPLLFVAHRERILAQSRERFREVLGRGDFGELFVGGRRPGDWRHVFASIQSLTSEGVERFPAEHFTHVYIDEFHHAEAATYRRLLAHLRPKVIVGLTATPERGDGLNVRELFGGSYAFEMRLWDALDQQLLAPFHYFGVADGVDLSGLHWERGGYITSELEAQYVVTTGHDARLVKVLRAMREHLTDVQEMRALGFCVSVTHAEYMAQRFLEHGIAAAAMSGRTSQAEREQQLRGLQAGRLKVIFAVDVLTEGVDVPEVDTILLLRPTESATVFLQQLGRGLRRHPRKDVCTVLDFIGGQRREFRADLRLRAMTGRSRAELVADVETGFPYLPSGCHLRLDRQAERDLLDNLRATTSTRRDHLAAELAQLHGQRGDLTLAGFVHHAMIDLADVYRGSSAGDPPGWTELRRRAGLHTRGPGPRDVELRRGIRKLLEVDDPLRLDALLALARGDRAFDDPRRRRAAQMLAFVLFADGAAPPTLDDVADVLELHDDLRDELLELADVLESDADLLTPALSGDPASALQLHATYRREEVLVALGDRRLGEKLAMREGVKHLPRAGTAPEGTDVFFVTLRKSERDYSPSTRYRDYAISRDLFHWESQSRTSRRSPTGQRYLSGSSRVLLFVREVNKVDGRAPGFRFLGPCTLVEARSEQPIAITWQLATPMPASFFRVARAAAV